jgi:hypothetical protein
MINYAKPRYLWFSIEDIPKRSIIPKILRSVIARKCYISFIVMKTLYMYHLYLENILYLIQKLGKPHQAQATSKRHPKAPYHSYNILHRVITHKSYYIS